MASHSFKAAAKTWADDYKRLALEFMKRAREVDPRERQIFVTEARRHWREAMYWQKEART